MKGWFADNARWLEGLAAFLVIVSAVIGIPIYQYMDLQSDVVIRIDKYENIVPEDLKAWLNQAGNDVFFARERGEVAEIVSEDLKAFLNSPVLNKLRQTNDFGVTSIEITNNSAEDIIGSRIRVDNVVELWGVSVGSPFITDEEAKKFSELMSTSYNGEYIVSELPSIPSGASLTILLTGWIHSVKPQLNAVGHSIELVEVVKVDDGLFVYIQENPWLSTYIGAMIFLGLFIIIGPIVITMINSVVRNQSKFVFYNKACEAALNEKPEDAMVLLKSAVDAGYTNKEKARNDGDLKSLRDRQDFKELFD